MLLAQQAPVSPARRGARHSREAPATAGVGASETQLSTTAYRAEPGWACGSHTAKLATWLGNLETSNLGVCAFRAS